MEFIELQKDAGIVKVILHRGKVNALNDQVIAELHSTLIDLEKDLNVKAIVISGSGKFFFLDLIFLNFFLTQNKNLQTI